MGGGRQWSVPSMGSQGVPGPGASSAGVSRMDTTNVCRLAV